MVLEWLFWLDVWKTCSLTLALVLWTVQSLGLTEVLCTAPGMKGISFLSSELYIGCSFTHLAPQPAALPWSEEYESPANPGVAEQARLSKLKEAETSSYTSKSLDSSSLPLFKWLLMWILTLELFAGRKPLLGTSFSIWLGTTGEDYWGTDLRSSDPRTACNWVCFRCMASWFQLNFEGSCNGFTDMKQ